MKKILLLISVTLVCNYVFAQLSDGFTKGEKNVEYKIYSGGSTQPVQYGNFIKMHVMQIYKGTKDSVLYDSDNFSNAVQPVDTVSMPMYYYDIVKQVKNGDSLVMRIVADSAFKNSNMPMPPMFEPGKYLYTCIKVLDVYTTKEVADSVMKVEQDAMIARQAENDKKIFDKQSALLQDYFTKNKIANVKKLPLGTYIQTIKKGVGKNATTANKVKVNYVGRTQVGKVFDSNTDPKFQHMQPFEVNLSQPGSVIRGWEEGLQAMNKGTKAVLFIPSPLAYGSQGAGGDIGPNEILIFDITVLDITPANAAAKPATPAVPKPANPKIKVGKPKVIKK